MAIDRSFLHREFSWEKAELEADGEIASGKINSFDSIEDFLSDLNF